MQVFISWSGDQSRSVAEALDKALRHIVRGASTFISTHDIDAGDRWEARLSEELEKSNHAVLCVTRDNQTAPWLNYEAWALGKLLGNSKVIPYTFGFPPNELKSGPLTRFQVCKTMSRAWSLFQSLSRSSTQRDDETFIREAFDMWWPRLHDTMAELLADNAATDEKSSPSERELLLEMRQDIRRLLNQIGSRTRASMQDAIEVLELALRDPLTGLPNRRVFTTRANELAASNTPYVIAYLDLDGFKSINDQLGHQQGDLVLVAVAGALRERLSGADLVARLGGDEFVAIFRDTPPVSVVKLLDEFIVALPEDIIAAGLSAVTASCGVSSDHIESGELKLRDADTAMYRAKQDGRARVILGD